ncbi:MAG: glutamine amidotransferase [Thermodesulfobacteriota bacterium]
MCGIAGLIARDSATLGRDLINMLQQLAHRGRDATGVAVYENRADVQVRVAMSDPDRQKDLEDIIGRHGRVISSRSYQGEGVFTFFEGSVDLTVQDLARLQWDIDSHPKLCVHSIGRKLKVYKDQGTAEDLRRRHDVRVGRCSHGLGHVRLATESVENINFAHPFISYLYPELTIVHNGQFTNYFNTRRSLESKGVRFKTNNDSEMAAHFLAYEMKEKGRDLAGAFHRALDSLDGVFTIVAATAEQLGAFRDRLGFKPVLYYERPDGSVLLGSEQIALTPIVSDVYATELEPGGVKVWSV